VVYTGTSYEYAVVTFPVPPLGPRSGPSLKVDDLEWDGSWLRHSALSRVSRVSRTGAEVEPGLSRSEQKGAWGHVGQEVGKRRDSGGITDIFEGVLSDGDLALSYPLRQQASERESYLLLPRGRLL